MLFALISSSSDTSSCVRLAYGTAKNITEAVVAECKSAVESFLPAGGVDAIDMLDVTTLDSLLQHPDYCDMDDSGLRELLRADSDSCRLELLGDFQFSLSDMVVSIACIVNGYSELVDAFAELAEDSFFEEYRLKPDFDESEENLARLSVELFDICCDGVQLIKNADLQFFCTTDIE